MSTSTLKTAKGNPPRKLQKRGEESRSRILNATLVLIAQRGLHGVTHRAIAAQAAVPLSLTTYFFSSLADLISQAFDHFLLAAGNENQRLLGEIGTYLDQYPAAALRDDARVRRQVHLDITARLAAFIRDEAEQNSVGLAVELNFLYLHRLEPGLRSRACAYRDVLVGNIAGLAGRMGSEQPLVDASLLLAVIHRLQFECMNQPPPWPASLLEAEIERMLALVLKL